MRVFIAGSGWFGMKAAETADESAEVVGVSSPSESRRGGGDLLALWADRKGVPWSGENSLRPEIVPDGTDLILAAHSHCVIGRLTRPRAKYAVGYHPSLLPLHRGRDSVKWQARMGKRVVGGSMYHLTDRIDGGPLASQKHVIVPFGVGASELWRDYLAPLGLIMISELIDSVEAGTVGYSPQDDSLATWEPSLDSSPLYRPELLQLGR